MIYVILLVIALGLFLADAFGVSHNRVNLLSLGLAVCVLAALLGSEYFV